MQGTLKKWTQHWPFRSRETPYMYLYWDPIFSFLGCNLGPPWPSLIRHLIIYTFKECSVHILKVMMYYRKKRITCIITWFHLCKYKKWKNVQFLSNVLCTFYLSGSTNDVMYWRKNYKKITCTFLYPHFYTILRINSRDHNKAKVHMKLHYKTFESR